MYNMANYTRPNDSEYEDTPEDWLNSALIFARALGLLLEDGTGIVVDLHGDMVSPDESGCGKVLVYSTSDGEIHIEGTDKDWPEGDFVKILPALTEN